MIKDDIIPYNRRREKEAAADDGLPALPPCHQSAEDAPNFPEADFGPISKCSHPPQSVTRAGHMAIWHSSMLN